MAQENKEAILTDAQTDNLDGQHNAIDRRVAIKQPMHVRKPTCIIIHTSATSKRNNTCQANLTTHVAHNQTTNVERDQTTHVERDQTTHVERDKLQHAITLGYINH